MYAKRLIPLIISLVLFSSFVLSSCEEEEEIFSLSETRINHSKPSPDVTDVPIYDYEDIELSEQLSAKVIDLRESIAEIEYTGDLSSFPLFGGYYQSDFTAVLEDYRGALDFLAEKIVPESFTERLKVQLIQELVEGIRAKHFNFFGTSYSNRGYIKDRNSLLSEGNDAQLLSISEQAVALMKTNIDTIYNYDYSVFQS